MHRDKRETVKLSAVRSPWCPLHLAKLAGPRGASACGQYAACVSLLNSPPAHQVRGRDDPNKGQKSDTAADYVNEVSLALPLRDLFMEE